MPEASLSSSMYGMSKWRSKILIEDVNMSEMTVRVFIVTVTEEM